MPYIIDEQYCGRCHETAIFAGAPDAASAGDGDCRHKRALAICEQCPTWAVCQEQTEFGDVALLDCIMHRVDTHQALYDGDAWRDYVNQVILKTKGESK